MVKYKLSILQSYNICKHKSKFLLKKIIIILNIYTCKYRIQLNVNDAIECAIFILFDKEAEKLFQTTARELSNICATVRPYN